MERPSEGKRKRNGFFGHSPADFEAGRRHGRELGCDGENTIEFPIWVGGCYGGGDAGKSSYWAIW